MQQGLPVSRIVNVEVNLSALQGQASCLQRLGDREAERDAVERYLARFPSGRHAAALRARRALLH